jgi:hypothetical protein
MKDSNNNVHEFNTLIDFIHESRFDLLAPKTADGNNSLIESVFV